MAHELEFINGQASYVGRSPGWHQLGTVREGLTYDQAMTDAHLKDWNVRVIPLAELTDNVIVSDYAEVNAIVRTHPETGDNEVLASAGGRYHAVQNEQAFAVAEFLTDMGATVETAGSIRGGRQVFMLLDNDKGFTLDPSGSNDRVQSYLLLRTSHDGTMSVEAVPTLVRVVCANTFDAVSMEGKRSAYKIRHTASAANALADAQAALVAAQGYMERFAQGAKALLTTPLGDGGLVDMYSRFDERPEDEGNAQTRWDNRFDEIVRLYHSETVENIRGTAWGGYNAMTERVDWERTTRGDGDTLLEAQLGFGGISPLNNKSRMLDAALSVASEHHGKPVEELLAV